MIAKLSPKGRLPTIEASLGVRRNVCKHGVQLRSHPLNLIEVILAQGSSRLLLLAPPRCGCPDTARPTCHMQIEKAMAHSVLNEKKPFWPVKPAQAAAFLIANSCFQIGFAQSPEAEKLPPITVRGTPAEPSDLSGIEGVAIGKTPIAATALSAAELRQAGTLALALALALALKLAFARKQRLLQRIEHKVRLHP